MAEERRYETFEAGAEAGLRPVHPGEILKEECLEPLGLTAAEFAGRVLVPVERVESLLRGERGVTADDALRIARYFGSTPEFWLRLQMQHDLVLARGLISSELEAITPRVGGDEA